MAAAVFGTVAAMWTLAVLTPGPNFLAVARVAAARSRRAGLAAVAGIGVGTCFWGLAGCFGVKAMFALAPWLFGALKLVGAAYLIALGGRIIVASFRPPGPAPALRAGPAFRLGLLTSLSNPKSALFVAALFAAVLPRVQDEAGDPVVTGLAAVAEMVAISVGWYGLVVWLLTTRRAAAAYRHGRRRIDCVAGGIFVAFGARLLLERAAP